MSVVKRLFMLLVVAVILLLGIFNAAETVTVHLGFRSFENAALPIVMVVLFLLGAFFMYLFSIARELGLRGEIRRLKKEQGKLDRQLKDLRNLSLEEGFAEDYDQGEDPTAEGKR